MKTSILIAIGCLSAAFGQTPVVIRLCDLVNEPQKFNGAEVTVRATYQ
jgi:hypothetical protein